jgi:proton-dependent oligopeptide transporter, POT family
MASDAKEVPQIYGHPAGLFTLFFTEMWERFSYYGMRALLLYYMIKGFLGLNDSSAYQVYGAYTALVYATPYFGGILADRVLGRRRAVVLGGFLMATGHLLMTYEHPTVFFTALAFLIVGNGFFKPNISTIVGELYPKTSEKKDAGFTIFYMGINLGAAMSPIICGYVGETYGWHFGFGLATAGMLVGVAIFVMPTRVSQMIIGGGVIGTAIALPFLQGSLLQLAVRIFMAVMLLVAGVIAVRALQVGPLPAWAGAPPSMEALKRKLLGFLPADFAIYVGSFAAVFGVAAIVQNKQIAAIVLNSVAILAFGYLFFEAIRSRKVERERLFVVIILAAFHTSFWAFFEQAGTSLNNWTDRNIDRVYETRNLTEADIGSTIEFRIMPKVPAGSELAGLPVLNQEQLGHVNADPTAKDLIAEAIRRIEAQRNTVRAEGDRLAPEEIDKLIDAVHAEPRFTMTGLNYLREAVRAPEGASEADKETAKKFERVTWKVGADNVGMGIADAEIPGSEFQAANPIYIILFGLVFSALWTFLGRRGRDPTAPVKFSLGLAQLSIGFFLFYYGTRVADARGMSSMTYLLLGWLFVTTGELCISPVGLSMVTKLAPKRLVSTVMGVWFVSITTANYIAAIIATITSPGKEGQSKITLLVDTVVDIFTGAGHGSGGLQLIPPPQATSDTYGSVFFMIAQIALGAAVLCFLLKWTLNKWMHPEAREEDELEAPKSEAPPSKEEPAPASA